MLEGGHDDLMWSADAVNIGGAERNREIAGINHAQIDMQRLPKLFPAPSARLGAFPAALIGPPLADALAAFDIFTAVLVQPPHLRLEPWIENGRSHGL